MGISPKGTVTVVPEAALLLVILYKGYHPKEFSGNECAPVAPPGVVQNQCESGKPLLERGWHRGV